MKAAGHGFEYCSRTLSNIFSPKGQQLFFFAWLVKFHKVRTESFKNMRRVVSCSLRLRMKLMSEGKRKVDKAKAKAMAESRKERGLVLKEIKDRGSATIPEISKATGLQESDVFKHVTALTQFGKVRVVGEKEGYLAYAAKE